MLFNPHTQVSSIRLLLVDDGIALGGVERMWLTLMPELSKICEVVVWMMPSHRHAPTLNSLPLDTAISFESFHWPRWNVAKLKSALITRLSIALKSTNFPILFSFEQQLFNERLDFLIRKHRITHVLYSALFNQPFPNVSVPVFASVMDINYHFSWRDDCLANLRVWAHKADCLLAISAFTKSEIEQVCFESHDNVIAIPLAIDLSTISESFDVAITPLHFYYPASFNPHKSHALLLDTLLQLHNDGMDFRLSLTGSLTLLLTSDDPLDYPELEAARMIYITAPDSYREKIDVLGRVSVEKVDMCYAHANLVLLPTAYEGFGLPLVEAVARGKRVVCSDIPAFREQVEFYGFWDAVSFVNGNSVKAWASGIETALSQSLSPYSIEQLISIFERRTWKKVAADYIDILTREGFSGY